MKTKISDQPGVFGVYDSVGNTYACVFVAQNNADAERRFFNLITTPDATIFSLNMNDFTLVRFDEKVTKVRAATDYSTGVIAKARQDRVLHYADNVAKEGDQSNA